MKISYVGNFRPVYSTENDIATAFESLGHEVVKIQEDATNASTVASHALSSDLLLITSTWDHALPLVDMIDLFKRCADVGVKTATVHLDTFWSTPRHGRKWWLNPMFHAAYIFTADGDYQDKWAAFGKKHIWMPPAVRHTAAHDGQYNSLYDCDVAFVGSNGIGYHEDVWGYRKELVDNLREMCKRNGWSFRNPGGDNPKVDRGESLNDFYASAKVTIGDSLCLNKEASQYWSDRVPEATGRGGLLIMPKIDALNDLYNGSLPMYDWGDYTDLESKVRLYLEDKKLNASTRKKTARITRAGYTYANVAQKIIDEVTK